jgi:hypothetical protein
MTDTLVKTYHAWLHCEPCGSCKVFALISPNGSVLLTPECGKTIEGCKLKGADLFIENGAGTKERYRVVSSDPSVFVHAVNVRVEKI